MRCFARPGGDLRLLNIINFTHGAQYMMGAFCAYFLCSRGWASATGGRLVIVPFVVGALGHRHRAADAVRLYKLDHLYGLLLTFRPRAHPCRACSASSTATSGIPYAMRPSSPGAHLRFMFMPNYRAWVIVASLVTCLGTWFVIERTKLGSYLRAATENPQLVQAFGINVPRMINAHATASACARRVRRRDGGPIYQVNPLMAPISSSWCSRWW